MKEVKESTIVGQAIETVEGFKEVYKKLHQQVTLRGQSRSTLENYIRRIAQISLQSGKLPEHIIDDEINEYVTAGPIIKITLTEQF